MPRGQIRGDFRSLTLGGEMPGQSATNGHPEPRKKPATRRVLPQTRQVLAVDIEHQVAATLVTDGKHRRGMRTHIDLLCRP